MACAIRCVSHRKSVIYPPCLSTLQYLSPGGRFSDCDLKLHCRLAQMDAWQPPQGSDDSAMLQGAGVQKGDPSAPQQGFKSGSQTRSSICPPRRATGQTEVSRECPGAVLPDWALYLPTCSHLSSINFSLSPAEPNFNRICSNVACRCHPLRMQLLVSPLPVVRRRP